MSEIKQRAQGADHPPRRGPPALGSHAAHLVSRMRHRHRASPASPRRSPGPALDLDKIAIVSGIGCTGRVAGYMKLDSFHTTHGRAIPFATGLKLANPELKVVVFSGDGDLIAIGGNHFIHAARRNIDLTVICVNNFNYAMTGGQVRPDHAGRPPSAAPPPTATTSTPSTCRPGRELRRGLRRPLDDPPRAAPHPVHRGGPGQAGLLLRRGHQPLSHPLHAAQQARAAGWT